MKLKVNDKFYENVIYNGKEYYAFGYIDEIIGNTIGVRFSRGLYPKSYKLPETNKEFNNIDFWPLRTDNTYYDIKYLINEVKINILQL
jgi:hypothetical protein